MTRKRDSIWTEAARISNAMHERGPVLTRADRVYDVMLPAFPELREQEHMVVLALDTAFRQVDVACLFTGGSATVHSDPATILRWALTRDRPVHGIVLAHNHPTGDALPSREDETMTAAMGRACQAVGLQLVDHLVIGGATFTSMVRMAEQQGKMQPLLGSRVTFA